MGGIDSLNGRGGRGSRSGSRGGFNELSELGNLIDLGTIVNLIGGRNGGRQTYTSNGRFDPREFGGPRISEGYFL